MAKYYLGICGLGTLGVITKYNPQEVTYPDGSKAMAYVGLHLTEAIGKIGDPWSSRDPMIIGTIDVPIKDVLRNLAGSKIS